MRIVEKTSLQRSRINVTHRQRCLILRCLMLFNIVTLFNFAYIRRLCKDVYSSLRILQNRQHFRPIFVLNVF